MKSSIVGLKKLRENLDAYITQIKRGKSFIVVKRSVPVLRISAPDDEAELWERTIDFTKIRKGGTPIADLLSRL